MILLFLLLVLAIAGATTAGVVWVGRALHRLTRLRWPFVVGAAALFALALAMVVLPVARPGGTRIATIVVVLGFLGSAICLAALIESGPKPTAADAWADAHGLTVTEGNADFVVAYVFEGHRLRLVCGFGGLIAAMSLSAGTGIDLRATGWVWLLTGYLGGVVWSEGWLTRLPADTTRMASLTPRKLVHYLARGMITAQVVVVLGALGLAGYTLVHGAHTSIDGGFDPEFGNASAQALRHGTVVLGAVAAALVVCVGLLQRSIVRKAQPMTVPDLLAADDAVRASAVHLLSGTVIAIVLLLIATQLRMLAAIGMMPDAVAGLGTLLGFVGALVSWRYFGNLAWVVRRRGGLPRRALSFEGAGR